MSYTAEKYVSGVFMKNLLLIVTILSSVFSFEAFASLESKCGKELSDRYLKVEDKLYEARFNRLVSKAIGETLEFYLSSSTGRIYANPDLQTTQFRCDIVAKAVEDVEKSVQESQNNTLIEKACHNIIN